MRMLTFALAGVVFGIGTKLAGQVSAPGQSVEELKAGQEIAPAKGAAIQGVCLDLQAHANLKLEQGTSLLPDNNLAELPRGDQVFAGVQFHVGDRYIQLGSKSHKAPTEVKGIPVDQNAEALLFFHGTRNGADEKNHVEDGDGVGDYRVHYEDGTTETIPIIYGEDVRDWWSWGGKPNVSRGAIGWTGQSKMSREYKQDIHLYVMSWKNPHPEKKVTTLDYLSTATGPAAPFCVAITVTPRPADAPAAKDEKP